MPRFFRPACRILLVESVTRCSQALKKTRAQLEMREEGLHLENSCLTECSEAAVLLSIPGSPIASSAPLSDASPRCIAMPPPARSLASAAGLPRSRTCLHGRGSGDGRLGRLADGARDVRLRRRSAAACLAPGDCRSKGARCTGRARRFAQGDGQRGGDNLGSSRTILASAGEVNTWSDASITANARRFRHVSRKAADTDNGSITSAVLGCATRDGAEHFPHPATVS